VYRLLGHKPQGKGQCVTEHKKVNVMTGGGGGQEQRTTQGVKCPPRHTIRRNPPSKGKNNTTHMCV